MRSIIKEPLIRSERYFNCGFLSKEAIEEALDKCVRKIDRSMEILGENFPTPATKDNAYGIMDNIEWTNRFWTGIL